MNQTPVRLRRNDTGNGQPTVVRTEEPTVTERSGRPLCCVNCLHPITTAADAVEVRGRLEHRATNPLGIEYEFTCFSDAPGCRTLDEPTASDSWFPPLSWSIALCRTCGIHLGWAFFSPVRLEFWGLITERLREGDAPRPH